MDDQQRPTELETAAESIAAWAASKPEIEQVWLFGSRVTGRRQSDGDPPRPDSDLDIAIKIDIELLKAQHGDEDDFSLLFDFSTDNEKSWVGELMQISPWRVHLQLYLPDMKRVSDAIEQGSMLIYERQQR